MAAALVWLELRRVPILRRLPQFVSAARMSRPGPLHAELNHSDLVFRLSDDEGFITLAPAIDYLIAHWMCQKEQPVSAAIYNLAHLELIFPLLLAKSASRQIFRIQRGDFEATVTHQAILLTDRFDQIPAVSGTVPVAIDCLMRRAECEPEHSAAAGRYKIRVAAAANQNRVEMPQNLYLRLKSEALGSMVPTTETSAQRGAGAGEIDND